MDQNTLTNVSAVCHCP